MVWMGKKEEEKRKKLKYRSYTEHCRWHVVTATLREPLTLSARRNVSLTSDKLLLFSDDILAHIADGNAEKILTLRHERTKHLRSSAKS